MGGAVSTVVRYIRCAQTTNSTRSDARCRRVALYKVLSPDGTASAQLCGQHKKRSLALGWSLVSWSP